MARFGQSLYELVRDVAIESELLCGGWQHEGERKSGPQEPGPVVEDRLVSDLTDMGSDDMLTASERPAHEPEPILTDDDDNRQPMLFPPIEDDVS